MDPLGATPPGSARPGASVVAALGSAAAEGDPEESTDALAAVLSRTAPVVVAHVDRDETVTRFGGALLADLDVDPSAWVGRRLADVVSDPTVLRLVRQGLEGQAGDDVVVLSGRSWVVSVEPVFEPTGPDHPVGAGTRRKVSGVVGVMTYDDYREVRRDLITQETLSEQLTAVTELSQDFISLASLDGRVTYVNRAGCELVGIDDPETAVGLPVEDFLDDEHRARLPATRRQIKLTGSFQGDNGLRHFGTGETIPVSMDSFLVTRRSDGRPIAVATVQRDLRTRIEAELTLVDRMQEQRLLADLGTVALTMSLEELVDRAVRVVGARYDGVTVDVRRDAQGTGPRGVGASSPRDGASDVLSCPVPGDAGPWGAVVCSAPEPRAWTEDDHLFVSSVAATLGAAVRRHELETTLQHQARHDPLTGLPNRTVMLDRITDALARADGTGARVGVLMLDLDDFKSVNDTLGHVRGDDLLAELAGRLAALVGDGETVARFGGDEFVVLVDDVDDLARVEALAQDLLDACATGVRLEGLQLALSASIGVALRHAGDGTAHSLLSEADIAMYQAKRDRPGSARFFDDTMRREMLDRLAIAGELRGAVAEGRIRVAYQPIVGLSAGALVAMEALARWTDASGRAVSPELFISVAEQTGLIGDLGDHVLRTACAEAARWQDRGPVGVRVNASAHELRDPRYADRVAQALVDGGLPAALLGIEITESAFVEEDTGAQDTLTRLREQGVSLLIDDFGTGYSSLSYLERFPVVDIVKIDRSFLSTGVRGEAVVQAVIGLGRAFGLQVCAEGVETPEQRATVTELGCDYAQGFLLGRPVAAEEARAVVASWTPRPPGS